MDEPKSSEPRDRPEPEEASVRVNFLTRAERHLWRKVFSGFLVVVPLGITFIILRTVVIFLDDILRPFLESTPLDFPGIGLVILLIGLYLIGAMVSASLGRRAFNLQGAVLTRIPIVKYIYVLARQATDALSTPMERKINRVVFIEWPRPGFMALGFVTGQTNAFEEGGSPRLIVYVPTVPNPTSGNLAFVAEEDIIDTDITVEEAMKTVFSGGIVPPDISQRGDIGTKNNGGA
jgi:uncharacterized membrane protein